MSSDSPQTPPAPDNSPQSNIDQDSPEHDQQIGMLRVRDSIELHSPIPMAFDTPTHPTLPDTVHTVDPQLGLSQGPK